MPIIKPQQDHAWYGRPWHLLFFAAYPSLALLSVNVGQTPLGAVIRPLAASLVLAGLVFLVAWLWLRDNDRAAFLAMLFVTLFFSYGHVVLLLTDKYSGVNWVPVLLTAWSILTLAAGFWSARRVPSATQLNLVGFLLVAAALVQLGAAQPTRQENGFGAKNAPVREGLSLPEPPPDIYYFILDSYGRADLLADVYSYDNQPFLNGLEARGFYVATCSQSNYVRTELSLASSLNMSYLQDLDSAFRPDSTARRVLWDALKHNAVRYTLERLGYRSIAYATGFDWSDMQDVDLFLRPPAMSSGLNEFEALFIDTTLARHLKDIGLVDPDAVMAQNYRDRFLHIFETVDDIARMRKPTFAHIHVISPHPPFVFGPEGRPTHPAQFWNAKRQYPASLYEKGYLNQLTYLNARVLEAVDIILQESATPPIIVIQGDHGPWLQPKDKRMWILNAYYVPGHESALYPTISPVNTFRMILNEYFGARYVMLDDVSYFSPVPDLYHFTPMPTTCTD